MASIQYETEEWRQRPAGDELLQSKPCLTTRSDCKASGSERPSRLSISASSSSDVARSDTLAMDFEQLWDVARKLFSSMAYSRRLLTDGRGGDLRALPAVLWLVQRLYANAVEAMRAWSISCKC